MGDNSDQTRPNSFARAKSGGLSGDSVWRAPSSSRPLPSLFGGVRSNAKPGAALAAAAAASRSVPTPHAAAIKSRRAVSLQKVMDTGESNSVVGDDHEIVSNSSTGDSIGVATERSRSDGKLGEEADNPGDFKSYLEDEISTRERNLETTTEVFPSKDLAGEVEARNKMEQLRATRDEQDQLNATTSFSNSTVYLHLEDGSKNLGSDDGKDEMMATVSSDGDSKFMDVNDSCKMDLISSSRDDDYGKLEWNSTEMPLEEGDYLGKDLNSYEDDVAGSAIGGSGDACSISDISELVEERIEQLESERISKREQKKLRSTMKPLDLAEELEKKQASTGLHWEEGAAAQPMKLEGVRRGSTTLGYFDIDATNAITRTIASQAFRRDHGSPQVLALHLNYIAVGMAKGVIVVAPSRYSSYNTDNMDSKVSSFLLLFFLCVFGVLLSIVLSLSLSLSSQFLLLLVRHRY